MSGLLRRLGPIIALIAALGSLAVLWLAVIADDPQRTGQGVELLGAAHCSGQVGDDRSNYEQARRDAIIVVFATEGCNSVPRATVEATASNFNAQRAALIAWGLPIARGTAVRLEQGLAQASTLYPSATGAGALDYATEAAADTMHAREALSAMALAQIAPGLRGQDVARVNGAVTLLSASDDLAADRYSARLRRGGGGPPLGLYDVWLTSRYGDGFLRAAIKRCQARCDWQAVISAQLRDRGYDAQASARAFAQAASERPRLVERLLLR